MGKFDVDKLDDALLVTSGVGLGAFGVGWLGPKDCCHDIFWKAEAPYNAEKTRYGGLTMLGCAATQFIGAHKNASRDTKSALLVTSGATWMAAGGMGVYNSTKGDQKKTPGLASAVPMIALGGTMFAEGVRRLAKKKDSAK